jgi:RNA polymerase sigma-70 factor (ECF subfamily)
MTNDEKLYQQVFTFLPKARRMARGLNCEAEDILHDVYIEILMYKRRKELWPDPLGLIYVMLSNRITDIWKKEERERRYLVELKEEMDTTIPEDPIEYEVVMRSGNTPEMDAALDSLKPEHFDVIFLKYYAGMTAKEIAEQLGVPEGTVATRLMRGRIKLAKALDKIRGEEIN